LMQPGQMAYDRAITVFSPDGRLFQVEYAREAVKRGTTTVGLKFKDGAVLIVDKRIASRLMEPKSIEKIFQIDEHIGCATSGLVADARVLVDHARVTAQVSKITYDERINVEMLVKRICDYKQNYTQYGGVRPFGTALLVAGVDDQGVHLFETDPSGALVSYKAGSIGAGRNVVMEVFEEQYQEGMEMEEAIVLGLRALKKATEEEKLNPKSVEIGVVRAGFNFRRLDDGEVEAVVEKSNAA
jgi:proteasome alpha subunit